MSTILEIRDGTPHWWNSTDIWIVPGNDPNGAPGQPIAGEPAYMWARVRNNGDAGATGAQVNFYWSNPATGVLRSNSTLIGSPFVDLDPGDVQDVLCLVPWVPTIVNDGHECVVAEVIHAADPLPNPLPDEFDPPSYNQIAQRNLSVLIMSTGMMVMAIQTAAPARKMLILELRVEMGGELEQASLAQLGLHKVKPAKDAMVKASLSVDRDCGELTEQKSCDRLKIELKPGTARAAYLKVTPRGLKPGFYTLISVIAHDQDRVIGGVTYIAVSAEEA